MTGPIKPNTWLHDLIEVYNDLGGTAKYEDVYRVAKTKRIERGASWTSEAAASIRRTVEDHAESSRNFRGRSVFYSVNGLGQGVWGLMPEYMRDKATESDDHKSAYIEGIEGIIQEKIYIGRSRDPRLAESRKIRDNYTCQACSFRLMISKNKYIIDVHHLNPLGNLSGITINSIEDLVCLCPNCHRTAHTNQNAPLSIEAIQNHLSKITH